MALLETLSFILERFPWSFGNRNHFNVLCYLPFLFFQFEADTRRHSWESWDWEMWKGSQFLQILRNKHKAPEKKWIGGEVEQLCFLMKNCNMGAVVVVSLLWDLFLEVFFMRLFCGHLSERCKWTRADYSYPFFQNTGRRIRNMIENFSFPSE